MQLKNLNHIFLGFNLVALATTIGLTFLTPFAVIALPFNLASIAFWFFLEHRVVERDVLEWNKFIAVHNETAGVIKELETRLARMETMSTLSTPFAGPTTPQLRMAQGMNR